ALPTPGRPRRQGARLGRHGLLPPLLRWATAGFVDRRLALAIDPTNLGDRFTVLTVSVVFRGCAVPVAWQVQRGDAKGSWNDHWERLLGLLRQALGEGWQVLVLSDRGL